MLMVYLFVVVQRTYQTYDDENDVCSNCGLWFIMGPLKIMFLYHTMWKLHASFSREFFNLVLFKSPLSLSNQSTWSTITTIGKINYALLHNYIDHLEYVLKYWKEQSKKGFVEAI